MSMNTSDLISIANITVSTFGVGVALYYAKRISKDLENAKNKLQKIKTWEETWAENFMNKALLFHSIVSKTIASYEMGLTFEIKLKSGQLNGLKYKEDSIYLLKEGRNGLYQLRELEWDCKQYLKAMGISLDLLNSFSSLQIALISIFTEIESGKVEKVDLEEIRKIQIDYLECIKKIHLELLKTN